MIRREARRERGQFSDDDELVRPGRVRLEQRRRDRPPRPIAGRARGLEVVSTFAGVLAVRVEEG